MVGTDNFIAGGNAAMDLHPIQMECKNTSSLLML